MMAADYPIINEARDPGPLVRREANAAARKRGDKLMPYHETEADRFELLLAELTAIRRDVADFVGAHRARAAASDTSVGALTKRFAEICAEQDASPPDDVA